VSGFAHWSESDDLDVLQASVELMKKSMPETS
jgi:hypothetical protein